MKPFRLDDPKARVKLKPRHAPYWLIIATGLALGYRRGARGGKWLLRMQDSKMAPARRQEGLGDADDENPADGIKILSYEQARSRALARFRGVPERHWDQPATMKTNLTVKTAVIAYLGWMERHRDRSWQRSFQMADCYILGHSLAEIPIADLMTEQIINWHNEIAEHRKMSRAGRKKSGGTRIPMGDAEDLEQERKSRKSSANRVLTILKAALKYQNELENGPQANEAVWTRVHRFNDAGRKLGQALDLSDQKKLIAACGPGLKELVQAALLTGARYSELAGLQVKKVIVSSGGFEVPVPKGKKEGSIFIPLLGEACRYFESLVENRKPDELVFLKADGTRWGRNHHSRPFKEAVLKSGLPNMRFHDLRHSFSTTLLKLKADPALVAKALGHKTTRMLEDHYEHLLVDYLAEALRKKVPRLGITSFAYPKRRPPAK